MDNRFPNHHLGLGGTVASIASAGAQAYMFSRNPEAYAKMTIAALVIGAVLFVVVLIVFVILFLQMKKKEDKQKK